MHGGVCTDDAESVRNGQDHRRDTIQIYVVQGLEAGGCDQGMRARVRAGESERRFNTRESWPAAKCV